MPSTDFHDITTGSNGYAAKSGYDLATGRGSPVAQNVISYLVSYGTGSSGTGTTTTTGSGTTTSTGSGTTTTTGGGTTTTGGGGTTGSGGGAFGGGWWFYGWGGWWYFGSFDQVASSSASANHGTTAFSLDASHTELATPAITHSATESSHAQVSAGP